MLLFLNIFMFPFFPKLNKYIFFQSGIFSLIQFARGCVSGYESRESRVESWESRTENWEPSWTLGSQIQMQNQNSLFILHVNELSLSLNLKRPSPACTNKQEYEWTNWRNHEFYKVLTVQPEAIPKRNRTRPLIWKYL